MSRWRRQWLPSMIVGVVITAGCTAETEQVTSAQEPSPSSETGDEPNTSLGAVDVGLRVAALGSALTDTPYWATIRRAGAVPVDELIRSSSGFVTGNLLGIEVGPVQRLTPSEALGIDPVLIDEAGQTMEITMERVDAFLLLAVSDADGALAGLPTPGEVVAVSIPIWLAGENASVGEVTGEIASRLNEIAPIGSLATVLVTDVVRSGDRTVVTTAGDTNAASLTSVVFEDVPGTLVSLDPLIGSEANQYWEVSNLSNVQDLVIP